VKYSQKKEKKIERNPTEQTNDRNAVCQQNNNNDKKTIGFFFLNVKGKRTQLTKGKKYI